MTDPSDISNEVLEQYLLGQLEDSRRQSISERIIKDENLRKRLQELAEDLARIRAILASEISDSEPGERIDDATLGRYLDGSLTIDEYEALTECISRSPGLQKRLVEIHRAVCAASDETTPVTFSEKHPSDSTVDFSRSQRETAESRIDEEVPKIDADDEERKGRSMEGSS